MTSFYFEDIFERYASEIDDLRTDSEGKDVLKKRVREKHSEFPFLLSMIDSAPEMVASALHGAFRFTAPKALHAASHTEPGDGSFPSWDELTESLEIAPWAQPLIAQSLKQDGGADFLVTAAVLEWMLGSGAIARAAAPSASDEDEDSDDLGEAGEEWLSEQGFDAVDR
ncbi:MAG: hypothetical protein JSR69_15390 [Proteobacteria bacterium]|nr:hypothetical protein [Pseudomonadota bacterium]